MCTIIFFLSPVLAVPFILSEIKRRRQYAVILFCLFLGVIAYCTIPTQDLFRHFAHYEHYSTYNFTDFEWKDFELNGIIVYLYCLMGKLSIPFDILRLFTVSIGFYLLYDVFQFKIKKNGYIYSNKDWFYRFLILFFFFDLFYTISGVRYGFALTLYIYGAFCYIEKKSYLISLIYVLLACLYHPSFIFLSIVTYSIYLIRISPRKMLIYTIFAYLIMSFWMSKYGYLLGVRQDWYLKGGGVTSYSNMTINGLIGFFLPKFFGLCFAIPLIKNFNNKSKWMRLALAWMLISLISLNNAVFFYRFWWGFMALGIYTFIDREQMYGVIPREFKLTLIASLCFFLTSLIPAHGKLMKSEYSRIIEPIPLIFSKYYTTDYVLKLYPDAGDFTSNL